MFEFIKRIPTFYLPLLKITAPVVIAVRTVKVQNAFTQSGLGAAAKEAGIMLADVGMLGTVTVGQGVVAVLRSRKAVPAPIVDAAPADHLTAPVAKKIEGKDSQHLQA